ncbi:hypothetical protein F4782DRAFT_536007 [Xylaria castorea]|nr:hypothetical protein F4782DRAFT_536007 [Xylaria castorea]
MAYKAAIRLVDSQQQMRLVELHDINIERAMRLKEDSSGLEVVFTVRLTSQSDDYIAANVACYSSPVNSVQPLDAPQAKLTTHSTGGVQGLPAGLSYPGDGRVGCIYLPTRVECVRISMMPSEPQDILVLNVDATVTSTGKTSLTGDLRKKILKQELMLMGKYRRHMMTWVLEHLLPWIDAGEHPEVRPEWKNDTLETVQQWRDSQPANNNDMNILHAMGKNIVSIVRGTTPPLKVLTQDGMFDRLYAKGLGAKDGNADLGIMVKQLAHQYPRINITEVGTGTGGTTRTVLDALGTQDLSKNRTTWWFCRTVYTRQEVSTKLYATADNFSVQEVD